MNQAQLDSIKEKSAEVFIQYTNGLSDAALGGGGGYNDILDNCCRLHYLYGIIKLIMVSIG